MRKLRKSEAVRNLVAETCLSASDFVLPCFVVGGSNVRESVKSMPGIFRLSVDNLIRDITDSGEIKSILLFGIPEKKDTSGTEAYRKHGIVQKAIRAIKAEFKELVVTTDVCLCGYASHGHCGILHKKKKLSPIPEIDTSATLNVLGKISASHADAGADFVAPSAMMDHQVQAIREALDKDGFEDTGILGYSAKYSSSFYGPFREAFGSAPEFGDRKSYQMDTRNSDEAMREIQQDIDEGADIVMVKPALFYLDIIYRAKRKFSVPLAAYNVSGEYSMLKFASQKGLVDEKEAALEILTSIKRAGADFIITYWAKQAVRWIKEA